MGDNGNLAVFNKEEIQQGGMRTLVFVPTTTKKQELMTKVLVSEELKEGALVVEARSKGVTSCVVVTNK